MRAPLGFGVVCGLALGCGGPAPGVPSQGPIAPAAVASAPPVKVGPRVPSIYEFPPFSVPLWNLAAHKPGDHVGVTRVDCIQETGRTQSYAPRCAPRGQLPMPAAMFREPSLERLAKCTPLEERRATKELVDLMLSNAPPDALTRAAGGGLLIVRTLSATVGESSHSSGCPPNHRGGCDPIMITELGPPGSGTPEAGHTRVCLGASCQSVMVGVAEQEPTDLVFPPETNVYTNFDRRFILDQNTDVDDLRRRLEATPWDAEPFDKEAIITINLVHLAILRGDHDALRRHEGRLDAALQRGRAAQPPLNVMALELVRGRIEGLLNGTLVTKDPCAAPAALLPIP